MIYLPLLWDSEENQGLIWSAMPLGRWGNHASLRTVSLSTVSSWDLLGQLKAWEPRKGKKWKVWRYPLCKCWKARSLLQGTVCHLSRSQPHLQGWGTYLHISTPLLAEAPEKGMIPRQPGKKNVLGKKRIRLSVQQNISKLCKSAVWGLHVTSPLLHHLSAQA